MKTLETLYQEILASDELKKDLAQAAQSPEGLETWIRAQGCEVTAKEIEAFLKEKQEKTGDLTDDELASAAGGCNGAEVVGSICTLGLDCIVGVIISACGDGVGPGGPNGKVICHNNHGN